jgi:hypothetical protein
VADGRRGKATTRSRSLARVTDAGALELIPHEHARVKSHARVVKRPPWIASALVRSSSASWLCVLMLRAHLSMYTVPLSRDCVGHVQDDEDAHAAHHRPRRTPPARSDMQRRQLWEFLP